MNTATLSDEYIKFDLNNYQEGQKNEDSINKQDSEVVVHNNQDCNKDRNKCILHVYT